MSHDHRVKLPVASAIASKLALQPLTTTTVLCVFDNKCAWRNVGVVLDPLSYKEGSPPSV